MIKAKLGQYIDGWIHKAFPFLFKRSVNPNLLTLFGTSVSVGASALLALGYFPLGGILLLAGSFFDLIDGVVARHFGTSTPFGAFLDSSMDRLVDMVVLLAIVVYYGEQGRPGVAVLAGAVLVASVMTSYTKARAEQFIQELSGGFLERGERIGLIATGAILDLMVPILWILAIGTTFTVIQRFLTAHRAMGQEALEEAVAQTATVPEHS